MYFYYLYMDLEWKWQEIYIKLDNQVPRLKKIYIMHVGGRRNQTETDLCRKMLFQMQK